jgi:hypothetical protein
MTVAEFLGNLAGAAVAVLCIVAVVCWVVDVIVDGW